MKNFSYRASAVAIYSAKGSGISLDPLNMDVLLYFLLEITFAFHLTEGETDVHNLFYNWN